MTDINKRLGKGLSSLLGEKNISYNNIIYANSKDNVLQDIPINLIIRNENQPRKYFNEESLNELAVSIKEYGILQPIIVKKSSTEEGKFEIISGERRTRAAKIAGLLKIPVIVKNFNERETFALSVIENIQREDLNIIEEAKAYKEFIEVYDFTQQTLSEAIGKSRSHISNSIRLLNLPEKILQYIVEKKIETGHAKALIGFEEAEKFVDYIIENKLTVRDIEKLVKGEIKIDLDLFVENENNENKNINEENEEEKNQILSLKHTLKEKENNIIQKTGYKCKITFNNKKNNGNIIFQYTNLEELDSLLNKIQ